MYFLPGCSVFSQPFEHSQLWLMVSSKVCVPRAPDGSLWVFSVKMSHFSPSKLRIRAHVCLHTIQNAFCFCPRLSLYRGHTKDALPSENQHEKQVGPFKALPGTKVSMHSCCWGLHLDLNQACVWQTTNRTQRSTLSRLTLFTLNLVFCWSGSALGLKVVPFWEAKI